jgi:hypothetical protein
MIAEFLGISPQVGTEWTIMCPSPNHQDHRPSASIYVGEPTERLKGGQLVWRLPGMWVCYSCGARGRVSTQGIEEYEPTTDRNLDVATQLLDEAGRTYFPESWLDLFDYYDGTHPYWLSRFSEATCWQHRLGYDFDTDCGTYPLRDNQGRVLGVVRRDFSGDRPWKYKYPTGIDIGTLMYGYSEIATYGASTIVLTEGALDAIAVQEVGYNGLAIYGSKLRPAQETLIRKLYPDLIVTAFDNDDAGREAHESVMEAVGYRFTVIQAELGQYKDIAEAPPEARREILYETVTNGA